MAEPLLIKISQKITLQRIKTWLCNVGMYKNVKHFFVKFWGILKHRRRFQEYYSEIRSNCGTREVGRSFRGKDILRGLDNFFLGGGKIFWEVERLGKKICFERLGEVFGKYIFWEVGRKDIIWEVGRSFGGKYILRTPFVSNSVFLKYRDMI